MEFICVFIGMFLLLIVFVVVIVCSDVGELDFLGNEVIGCIGIVCGLEFVGNVDIGGIVKVNFCCKVFSSFIFVWCVVVFLLLFFCLNVICMF